jgi:hypothetical protein
MIARWLSISSAMALAACNQVSGLSDFEIGAGGQGATTSQGGAAGTAGSPDGGAAGAPPPPACLVAPIDFQTTTIGWAPNPPTTADAVIFNVTDTTYPFTDVALLLCTPTGPRLISSVDAVQCSTVRNGPPCTWTFHTEPLPAGTTQAIFSAMLQATTVETTDVLVIK